MNHQSHNEGHSSSSLPLFESGSNHLISRLTAGLRKQYQFYTEGHPLIDFTRLQLNNIGAPPVDMVSTGGVAPSYIRTERSTRISVVRPLNAIDGASVGSWLRLRLHESGFFLKRKFAVFATFRRPVVAPSPAEGYAMSILLRLDNDPGKQFGAACQRKNGGFCLNLPSVGPAVPTNLIHPDLEARVNRVQDPALVTVALRYQASQKAQSGLAALFVGDDLADSQTFDLSVLNDEGTITDLLAGIGTVSGAGYMAAADLVDLQLWDPNLAFV